MPWSSDQLPASQQHLHVGAMMHLNGFIPDTDTEAMSFDKFQAKFSVSASASSEHVIPEFTPISDQGDLPSCTANAAVDIVEALIGLQDPIKVVQLSRMAAWWVARRCEGTDQQITGVRLSTMFAALAAIGVCPEDMWPYSPPDGLALDTYVMRKPRIGAFACMSDNKITNWLRIYEVGDALLDAVDYAIFANHPVGYGTAIDNSFVQGKGVLRPPENLDDVVGRHAIAIFGRRKVEGRRQYWIRNSWGLDWADRGHVWVDESYLTWSEATNFTIGTCATDLVV